MQHMSINTILLETIFTSIIAFLSFLIYYETKEIYALTKHKGIKYFRNAFLLFSLAHLARLFFQSIKLGVKSLGVKFQMFTLMPFALLITSYLSTIAIFYLTLSLFSKKAKKQFEIFLHIIAILISFYVSMTHSILTLGITQIILLIIAIIVYFAINSKFTNIVGIYTLLMIFWIFNIFVLDPRIMLPIEIKLFFYTLSVSIFIIINKKVRKWTK